MVKTQTQIIYFVHRFVTIIHQNTNGLLNKSDMISVCINELATQDYPVDILCITEHNMMAGDEVYLTIPNFKIASYYMRASRHGGSCILIKNNIEFYITSLNFQLATQ